MGEHLSLRGELTGHNGWITSIATTLQAPDTLLTASRDKTLILWDLSNKGEYSRADDCRPVQLQVQPCIAQNSARSAPHHAAGYSDRRH